MQETSKPLYLEQEQTQVNLELITEATTVTATKAPESFPFVPSQGFSILEIQSFTTVSVIMSPPVDSFVSVPPLENTPLRPGLLVDEFPTSQVQYLMALAQRLQGMAFAFNPTTVHPFLPTPEIPVQPTIAL